LGVSSSSRTTGDEDEDEDDYENYRDEDEDGHGRGGLMEGEDRRWVRNVAILWLAELVAIMGMSLVMPFLPLYLNELGVTGDATRLWAGWVSGANFLCAALLAPVWGTLADRVGRKPMAVRALIGLAVAVALMGFAQNVYQLFALRLLQGAFGGFVAAAIALAGTMVPRERLGAALGFLQTAIVGGHLVGPLLGGELSHRFGYRNTFLITGGALVVATLLVVFFIREEHAAPEGKDRKGMAAGIRELLRLPALRWMLATVLCCQAGMMLINPQISLFVRDLIRDPEHLNRWVGLVIAAPAVSSFMMAPLWGRAGDRRGHALMLGLALLGAGLVIAPAGMAGLIWQLLAIRFCMGAFTAALNPSAHSVVAHSVDERRTASAFSLVSSAQMLGACLGPFLSGPLAAGFGIRPLFPVTGALLLAASFAAFRARAVRKAVPLET
jgi:MFS transporter, DHA1 family, multidrug resistance protein